MLFDRNKFFFDTAADYLGIGSDQRARNEQERQRQEQLTRDLKKLLDDATFRRFLWYVLSLCKVMDKSMDVNPVIMAFREGQRDIGIHIMQEVMTAAPEAYEVMRAEHTKQAEEEAESFKRIKEAILHE